MTIGGMHMIDITGVISAILMLIGAAITTYLIPWIKSKTTVEQRRIAQMLVRTAVYAAEQLFKGDGRGEEKLKYVARRLEEAGIKLEVAILRDMIEAAVMQLAIERDWGIVEEGGGQGTFDGEGELGEPNVLQEGNG
jgi:Na+(H+)/acetate symporter ActP